VFQQLTEDEISEASNIPIDPANEWTPIMPVPDGVPHKAPVHRGFKKKPDKVWPYLNEKGKLLGAIARFDLPDGDKEMRPLTYCEKGDQQKWRWQAMLSPRPIYALDLLAQKPTAPVLVVEGEKAADAAQELFPDYVVTTAPMGSQAPHKADWRSLWGRRVTIWPDNDEAGDKYANTVVKLAKKYRASFVAIVDIPPEFSPKWDLADPPPDGWPLERLKSLIETAPEINLGITLSIGSDIEIARRVNEDLINRHGDIVISEGGVWRYMDTHWEPILDSELRRTVHRYDGATFGKESIVRLSKSRIDSILNEFVAMHDNLDYFVDAPTGINCLGGFIVFPKGGGDPVLEPHSPEHRCRHVIPASWPSNNSDDIWPNSLLANLLGGCFKGDLDAADKINLLGEVTGAAVLGKGARLMKPKAIVLKGETAENGKSQVLDVIRGLLPPSAVSAIPLGKMGDEKFVCGLTGKWLNASDELTSAAAVASDTFKQVVTGEPITARNVYSPAVTFRPVAQHIYATNDLPSFKGGMDKGVQRRLLVLPFNRTIPEDERIDHIGDRIATEEMALLLEWAVNGAQRLLKQRFFTEPPSSKEALQDWLYGSDPVLAWLDQGARLSPTAEAKSSLAYAAFKKWAENEGYRGNTLPAINTFSVRVQASDKGISSTRTSAGRVLTGLTVHSEDLPHDMMQS
jgi:P4 family phage/plasmid primase-like protien